MCEASRTDCKQVLSWHEVQIAGGRLLGGGGVGFSGPIVILILELLLETRAPLLAVL